MNRKIIFTILICILTVPIYGQQYEDVFDNTLRPVFDKTIELNNSKNYLEAFNAISTAVKELDAIMYSNGINLSSLEDWQFANYYWPIKKSQAEIAYMLGNYMLMGEVASKLRTDLTIIASMEKFRDKLNDYYSDLAKIDGDYYYLTEKYDSAETSLYQTLRLRGEYLDFDFDFFYAVRGDLAQLYYKKECYTAALAQLDTILMHNKFAEDARASKEFEIEEKRWEINSQRAICLARLGRYDEALKEIEAVVRHFKKASNKRTYAEALRKKAKILMLQYDATGIYNPVAQNCYQEYLTISRDFIDNHFVNMSESEREQYWMAEQPFVTDCYRLEAKAPALLYDVALYSKAVLLQMGRDFKEDMTVAEKGKALASIRVKWQDVRDKLPSDACAIEFIVYEKQGKNHIGALVLNKKLASPKFVDISNIASIRDYPLASAFDVKKVLKDTRNDSEIFWLYNDEGLNTLIWNSQLIEAIGGCKQVYFSPDGIFHQLAIEYMSPKELVDKNFYRLTSTRLLTEQRKHVQTDNMLICSGIDYRSSVRDDETGNDALAYSMLASKDDIQLNPLSFSEREADSIMVIRHGHPSDKVLRADSVTEATLYQLLGKYNIVHISTHGLFAELSKSGTDIRPSSSDTQLSKSCLFLSGSEQKLLQPDFDASHHDGVMSARELAKLDMHNVDLTVLSACMSGLGYITTDGVFGLQRGLKTAGVKAVISTLWEVDDEASSYFILCLYDGLESGLNLHDAFCAAREALRNTDKPDAEIKPTYGSFTQRWKNRRYSARNFNKPYFYNAFILIDGLE